MIINDLKNLNEDSVLIYHNNAYIKGYSYRTLDDVKELFKKSKDKIQWIKDYISELHTTFSNMKKFEHSDDKYAHKLKELSAPAYIYPFIIKGYKYLESDKQNLTNLFKLLEVIDLTGLVTKVRYYTSIKSNFCSIIQPIICIGGYMDMYHS